MRRQCPAGGRSRRLRGRCCSWRRINTWAEPDGEPFRAARNEYADSLFDLAKRAAEAGQLSLAFEWATEAVRENPDHADARRVLGYEQHDGQWLTPYAKRMVDAGKTWDPRAGWVAADDARRRASRAKTAGRSAPTIFL